MPVTVKMYVFRMLDKNTDTKCCPKRGKKMKLAIKFFDNHKEEVGFGRYMFFNEIYS